MRPGTFLLGSVSAEVCNFHDTRYLDKAFIESFLLSTQGGPLSRKCVKLRNDHGFLLGRNQNAIVVAPLLLTSVEVVKVLKIQLAARLWAA